ncbi:TPA: NADH:flavin oxidoreductase [Serratia odorifera]
MSLSPLFSPNAVNRLRLRNRLVVAPMTRVTASQDGIASERMQRYYQDFARGGFGLTITEGIYIDDQWSQTYDFQAGLINDAQANAWLSITDALHVHGGKMIAQLQHAGALSQSDRYRQGTVAPSAVQPQGEQLTFYRGEGQYPLPRQLSDAEIRAIIDSFAGAAERAVSQAGFDGVEIHAANGYLLDQFLTKHTNLRSDKWGGDTAQRMSLNLAVIDAVRSRLGNDALVGIRISQGKVNDFQHKWENAEQDARTVFTLLAESGVDYIHLTEHQAWQPAFADGGLSLVALARKYAPEVTIIANGGLHEVAKAEALLQQGADLIALGRGALANHDWPKRVEGGEPLREFDRRILGPIADIKDSELPS